MLTTKYLLFASFFLIYVTDATIEILKKSLKTDKELWYSHRLPSPRLLTFAMCEQNYDIGYLGRECHVTREKSPFSYETDSCNVTLKLNESSAKFVDTRVAIDVVSLTNDTVLLYMSEISYNPHMTFVTVNFNDCKVLAEKEISVVNLAKLPEDAVRIVAFDDSFEVHYLQQREQSADINHTRIVVDVQGKIIDGPSELEVGENQYLYFRSPMPDVFPIARDSRDKGVVYLKAHNETILPRMTVLRPDGTKQNFEVLNGNESSWKNVSRYISFSISTAHGLICICSTVSIGRPVFKCLQYDADGKMNFATDFIEDRETKYANVAAYNLPNGAILAAAIHLRQVPEEPKYCDLSVFKFDSNGKVVGKVFLKNFDSRGYDDVPLFYTNEREEYCLSDATYDNEVQKNLTLTAHCFTDADFVAYSIE